MLKPYSIPKLKKIHLSAKLSEKVFSKQISNTRWSCLTDITETKFPVEVVAIVRCCALTALSLIESAFWRHERVCDSSDIGEVAKHLL